MQLEGQNPALCWNQAKDPLWKPRAFRPVPSLHDQPDKRGSWGGRCWYAVQSSLESELAPALCAIADVRGARSCASEKTDANRSAIKIPSILTGATRLNTLCVRHSKLKRSTVPPSITYHSLACINDIYIEIGGSVRHSSRNLATLPEGSGLEPDLLATV